MDEEAFLSVLRDEPGDAVTWAALADWLDDSGQAERAELLRLLRRPRTPAASAAYGPRITPDAAALRAAELLAAGVKPVLVESTNSVGMRFVLVLPGRFLMGSPPDERDPGDEERQHEVTITKPYWMGVHPVTQAQWRAVMGNNPSYYSRGGDRNQAVENVPEAELDRFPVEHVSWTDAQQFLKQLRHSPTEKGRRLDYRLPTEGQWEYACRGGHLIQHAHDGHTLPFHFRWHTDSFSFDLANFNGAFPCGGAAQGPALDRTTAVGSYEANALGIHDMHGNVWEWCLDRFADYPNGPAVDPAGPSRGTTQRVNRGGAWTSHGRACRAARRNWCRPAFRNCDLGFRVVAVVRG